MCKPVYFTSYKDDDIVGIQTTEEADLPHITGITYAPGWNYNY